MNAALSRLGSAVASAWDRIVASDPGLERLGEAARTTVGVAAAVGAAELSVRYAHAPFTTEILAAVIAEITAISVRDPDTQARRLTTLLLPIPALASMALGSFINANAVASDAAFLAIMFAAVALRRFGPRLMSLGTLAFFGYFFAIFLGAKPAQLPWAIAGIIIGTACTFILRFFIFPDRPTVIVRRALATFLTRQRAVLDALPPALEESHWDTPRRREVRRAIAVLKECSLAIEDRLGESGSFSDAQKATLRLTLFDAELSTENLVARTLNAVAVDRGRIAGIARAIAAVAAELPGRTRSEDARDSRRIPTRALQTLRRTSAAMDRIEPGERPAPLPSSPTRAQPKPPSRQRRFGGFAQRLTPATRQAIQVTTASAIALVCGEFLSPRRWYWAVLAAFVVFSGTQSAGETRARAWSRSLGTAIGVVAGLALVLAVGNDHTLQLLLVFAFMFGAMYFFRTAYGIMVFFITALLALLYQILGTFSSSLLAMRLVETAVGSAIGVLVATFVLPTSARDALGSSAAALLEKLATVVERSVGRLLEPSDGDDPTRDAGELDAALADLLARAGPISSARPFAGGRADVRHRLLVLNACARYARNLARSARRARAAAPDAVREPLRRLGDGIAADIRTRAADLDGQAVTPADAAPPSDDAARFDDVDAALKSADGVTHGAIIPAVTELRHIARALRSLGAD